MISCMPCPGTHHLGATLGEFFREFDANGDGRVSEQELIDGLNAGLVVIIILLLYSNSQ